MSRAFKSKQGDQQNREDFPGENSVQGQGIKNPGYAFGNEGSGASTGYEDQGIAKLQNSGPEMN